MTTLAQISPAPAVFTFGQSFNIRVITIDGEPWFVARDIAAALGYAEPHKAVARHCKRAKSLSDPDGTKHPIQQNQDLDQKTKIIPQGDVCRLVVGSNLPGAVAFESWVFDEVIPSIIKTGRYQVAAPEPIPDYERCTTRQQQELATAMSRAFSYGLFGQEGTQHGFNRLRLAHRLHNIADLPAADFERALATVGEIAAMNLAFVIWVGELKKVYLAEYVEAGGPWTLWLKREWKKQMGTALPPRPDWLAIQEQLKLAQRAGEAQ